MSTHASQDRRRQRSEEQDDEQQPAPAAAFDKTAPLAVILLRRGLTEQQIVQDGWTALMSLPQIVVSSIMTVGLPSSMKAALETHVTLDVLKVKPSSPLSCEVVCRLAARFAGGGGDRGQELLGTTVVRDALLALRPQVTTAEACTEWCNVILTLANQQLFATAAARDALVAVQPRATTVAACIKWCSTLCSITDRLNIHRLYGTAARKRCAMRWWRCNHTRRRPMRARGGVAPSAT
jgi:hypothetical protein